MKKCKNGLSAVLLILIMALFAVATVNAQEEEMPTEEPAPAVSMPTPAPSESEMAAAGEPMDYTTNETVVTLSGSLSGETRDLFNFSPDTYTQSTDIYGTLAFTVNIDGIAEMKLALHEYDGTIAQFMTWDDDPRSYFKVFPMLAFVDPAMYELEAVFTPRFEDDGRHEIALNNKIADMINFNIFLNTVWGNTGEEKDLGFTLKLNETTLAEGNTLEASANFDIGFTGVDDKIGTGDADFGNFGIDVTYKGAFAEDMFKIEVPINFDVNHIGTATDVDVDLFIAPKFILSVEGGLFGAELTFDFDAWDNFNHPKLGIPIKLSSALESVVGTPLTISLETKIDGSLATESDIDATSGDYEDFGWDGLAFTAEWGVTNDTTLKCGYRFAPDGRAGFDNHGLFLGFSTSLSQSWTTSH